MVPGSHGRDCSMHDSSSLQSTTMLPFSPGSTEKCTLGAQSRPQSLTSHTSQHLAHFLLSLLGTRAATGRGGRELKQPNCQGAGEQAGPKRSLGSRSCTRATRRQQQSAGRRSHPALPASGRAEGGLLEKLARCGRSHLWPLSTHSLTRTVPIQFLGPGLQLLQLWLGSEASESQSRQDSGSC